MQFKSRLTLSVVKADNILRHLVQINLILWTTQAYQLLPLLYWLTQLAIQRRHHVCRHSSTS